MAASIICTFKDCTETFSSVEELKLHKECTVEHDYCEKCDVDFSDYDAYLYHKIKLQGVENSKRSIHIVCELCGKDFGSWSGKRRHQAIVWYLCLCYAITATNHDSVSSS
jgi:hypothetical protein